MTNSWTVIVLKIPFLFRFQLCLILQVRQDSHMALPYLWFSLVQTFLRQWNYKFVSATVISYPCHFMTPVMLFSSQTLLPPLWHCSLILGRDDTVVLFKDDHSTGTCSQHLNRHECAVISHYWKGKLLWSRLMTALVYQCKHKYSRAGLSAKKKMCSRFTLSVYNLLCHGHLAFDQVHSMHHVMPIIHRCNMRG